ncbi:MAG: Hsp20/alpha crystallin family protein [Burkholderiaceae bacterium]|nr:Hsp20/alpha crystallin family protein [Sulfuritalea sp.]MCF8174951.1 Hsp20/alpha crystallin family protein [Burkholderiaceae bacterium]MCF8183842.1 Hsp20/alpha crystallin family protein [Polynucleobacter sp.]
MSNLIRRDPLDDFFRGFFVRPVDFGSQADAPAVKIDVKEQENAYLVHAEIPGVKKDDIHVAIEGAVVSISAERREEKDVREGERVLRSERYVGKVSRSFQLAQEIDEGQVNAKYVDGVLELVMPKKAATQARRITIQ